MAWNGGETGWTSMIRALMVEPQGQGGICQYTYCLSQALRDMGCDITLATARPYELDFARPSYAIERVFGPGRTRLIGQRLLGRDHRRAAAQAIPGGRHPASDARPLGGAGGRASAWLRRQEYQAGWRRTLRLAAARQPVVAHVQWLSDPERDVAWLVRLRDLGVRVVLTAHNVIPHDAPPSMRATWRRLYDAADAIIAHYPVAMDELAELGVARARVAVIPHGNYLPIAKLAGGDSGPQRQREARAALGRDPAAPIALFFGLIRPYKGIDDLLEAFARARASLPAGAQLLLAGAAPEGFDSIRQHIARTGLNDAVTAAPRYIPLGEVAPWFEAADLVVLPYVEASQSGVAQLAFAFGRPVIVTHVGGLPDVIVDGLTGVVVPPRDVGALAGALIEMLGDRERCAVWGERAYSIARDRLAWPPIAARTVELYERVAASSHGLR